MYEDTRDSPCDYCLGVNDYTWDPRVLGKDGPRYAQAAHDGRDNSLVCKRSHLVSEEELDRCISTLPITWLHILKLYYQ